MVTFLHNANWDQRWWPTWDRGRIDQGGGDDSRVPYGSDTWSPHGHCIGYKLSLRRAVKMGPKKATQSRPILGAVDIGCQVIASRQINIVAARDIKCETIKVLFCLDGRDY